MTEKERELKAFNQCADALNALDKKSIFKVFQLLSIHFEFMPVIGNGNRDNGDTQNPPFQITNNKGTTVGDEEMEREQQIKKTPKATPKKSKAGNVNSATPSFLADYDFRPPNNEALKDFYAKFDAGTNYENNLLFIYYLQEVVKEETITLDHVYSCYRHLGLKIPSFPQSLKDTKKAKGWITTNPSDLKVTRAGINYLEHEMKKNDD